METAIDKPFQCPRTLSRRVADDYAPPFPMFVARAAQDLQKVVMCYLGVQYHGEEHRDEAFAALRHIVEGFGIEDGPGEYDATHHQDNQGYDNLIAVGYWRDPAVYERWLSRPEIAGWWNSDERLGGNIGFFREIVCPRAEQFETLYAFTEGFPGVGAIMDDVSDEIEEHAYWGSARDRLPKSQTDWLYFEEIEPVLRAGMDFLGDNGQDLGCYSNRYVRYVDLEGNLQDKTYNIGHWRALDLLERWAESHPTHLRIFTTFFKVVTSLEKLRLYHEVSVFDAGDQFYEYINCHPATGMLRDAAVPTAA